ncbi:MAG: LemA family protein, partial [Proteobacteria bacterium]|nr:LemA family protein [Pseudomonadota bacterium]
LRTFPTTIWAHTFYSGSKPMQPFTASAAAQAAPTVNFDTTAPGAAPGSAPPEPAKK